MEEVRRDSGQDTPAPHVTPFPEQNADGVDLSLIRRNLAMTPYERVVQAERYAEEVKWIHAHARRIA